MSSAASIEMTQISSAPPPPIETAVPLPTNESTTSASAAGADATPPPVRRGVTFHTDVINVVLNAPDKLVNEAVKKTEHFRPRGMIIFASAFFSIVIIGVGLASRVGEINTTNADGSATNAYVTLWKVCNATTSCKTGVTTCDKTTKCADPADFNCTSESRRYLLARALYVIAMLVNVPLAVIGVLDAMRRIPGMLPGGVVSVRMLIISVSIAASLMALLGFAVAMTTWVGVHCGPASSSLPGAQPGRGPFLALLGAMTAAGATTSACVTRTRYEEMMEEASRDADSNGVVTLTPEQQAALAKAMEPKKDKQKKRRKKWLYDDPEDELAA